MAKTEVVCAQVDTQTKEEASRVLGEMGLTVSGGIRLSLRSVATKKKLPFHPMDFFEPNAETIAAMEEAERGEVHSVSSIEELMAELRAPD